MRKIEKDSGNQLFWAESLVMTYFMAFGGGIIAPFLLGKPPVMFVNDLIVPLVRFFFFFSLVLDALVHLIPLHFCRRSAAAALFVDVPKLLM